MLTPGSIVPMRLVRVPEPFDRDDFIFELKYDGFRAVAHIAQGTCQLVSRNRNVFKRFGKLASEIARAVQIDCVLDGEIVALDSDGRPQFYDLMRRRGDLCFYAFDVLAVGDEDLRDRPLIERKARLRRIVPNRESRVLYVSHFERTGVDLFRVVCEQDLEGTVAKWKYGAYLDGAAEQTSWFKVKNSTYSQAEGRRELFQKRLAPAG